jgi:SAM-dependent methyltransferase
MRFDDEGGGPGMLETDVHGGIGPGEGSWYRRWFGEEYMELYPHRDREEAREAVALFLEHADVGEGDPVLDLACGAGRHLEGLLEEGLDAVGLDLSLPLLRRASGRQPAMRLIRGDMRSLPFRSATFAAVSSFFTSFGYFESEADDRMVLREVRRVLRQGGHLLLDFLNARAVQRNLTPRDERTVGEWRVVQERRLVRGGRVVEKRIRIEDGAEGEPREFLERVRLYMPRELESLLAREGLTPVERFGDYEGGPVSPASPRVILLAEATS